MHVVIWLQTMSFSKILKNLIEHLLGDNVFDMGSPFLEAGVTSAFLIISGNVLVLIQLLKKNLFFFIIGRKRFLEYWYWNVIWRSLFPGSSFMKFKTFFLETASKEKCLSSHSNKSATFGVTRLTKMKNKLDLM